MALERDFATADDIFPPFDWGAIGSKAWLQQQFTQLHNEHREIMGKLRDLEQQYFVLLEAINEVDKKLDAAPWIRAVSLGVTFDPPVMK